MINWTWRTYQELTKDELYEILSLRQEVFAIEQNCLYQDLDYLDQKAIHLMGRKNGTLISYLRLFSEGIIYQNAVSFGRVLTCQSERGKGLAHQAMDQVLQFLACEGKKISIEISAQLYLKEFYSKYGLKITGEPYDEDGIPHIKMKGSFDFTKNNSNVPLESS